MRVAFRRVEEQIAYLRARDVEGFGSDVGEDYAGGGGGCGPGAGEGEEVCFADVREAEEPEDGIRDRLEDAEPRSKRRGLDLETHTHTVS